MSLVTTATKSSYDTNGWALISTRIFYFYCPIRVKFRTNNLKETLPNTKTFVESGSEKVIPLFLPV
jgi:hypothetical protein